MKKTDLYDLALSLMDLQVDNLLPTSKEIRLLDLNYEKVVQFCLKAWEFPFLVKRIAYTLEDLTDEVWTHSFGYYLPHDFGVAVQLNGSRKNAYSIRFGCLWCDVADPILEYMPNAIDADTDGNFLAPHDFLSLVAYQLALHAAPTIDPESKAMVNAAQMYQLTLASIMESENRGNDRPHNFEASEQWGEEATFSANDLRDYLNGVI